MYDLSVCNRILNDLSLINPCITPVTSDDYVLFQRFFDTEEKEGRHTYGNSWTYVTQGAYGIGPHNLGYKYYDGENIAMLTLFPKIEDPSQLAMYWVRPIGKTILDTIRKIATFVKKNYNAATYAKKIHKDQYDYLLSHEFSDVTTYPWHSASPAEDDTYPEQILDLNNTLYTAQNIGRTRQLSRSLRNYQYYKKRHLVEISIVGKKEKLAYSVVKQFTDYQMNKNPYYYSIPEDYNNLITSVVPSERRYDGLLYLKDRYDKPLGYFYSEKFISRYASLYASLTLRQESNYMIDYFLFHLIYTLLKQKYKYLNLGGSEQKSLDLFKCKYRPISQNKMFWCYYK